MKRLKKNSNQKSFYFEDYIDNNNLVTVRSKFVNISLSRVSLIFYIFLCLVIIFAFKLLYYAGFDEKNIYYNSQKTKVLKGRGDIVDRNGVLIARNTNGFNAGVRSPLVRDHKKFLLDIKFIFPSKDLKIIKENLERKKFFYLEKRLTETEREKLWLLKGKMGNNAIVLEPRQIRFYPQKSLFSHVLGQVDEDNFGISGIEKFFDKDLKNKKLINSSLNLTLDSNLQYLIREELIRAKFNFRNVGSAAILMDVNNGEILSLVSLPDYDLNRRILIDNHAYTNKITMGVYELGSVFKTFTLAAGLENKVIKPDTIFKDLENSLTCDKYKINEHDKLPKNLSAEQILIRSSNIGAVKIAQKIGIENYKNFLESFEFFQKINFDLDEIGTPLPFRWGKCKLATASYGHGITTTPLQLARAYAILGNGGYKIKPSILKREIRLTEKKEQIISLQTSNEINSMLRKVVNLDEGTANFANIHGYEVGGKTGTALKYNKNTKLNTFVSLFPTSNPKYVLLVMLDEPQPAPNYVYNLPNGNKHKGEMRNTSGWNTVVVAGKIIKKIGPILATNYLQVSNKF